MNMYNIAMFIFKRIGKRVSFIAAIGLFTAGTGHSQTFHFMAGKNDFLVDTLTVYPPLHPEPNSNPVLYLFGNAEQAAFTRTMINELSRHSKMPATWVVQMPVLDLDPELTHTRLSSFLEEQFQKVEEKWEMAPYRLAAGHDIGALNALQLMFNDYDLFDAFILAAPPIYRLKDPERQYRTFLVEYMDFDGFVFIANGFGDQGAMRESQLLTRLMKSHSVERPMQYHFELMENETNASVFANALSKGLIALFADTQMTTMMPYGGMEGWWNRKEQLIQKYGYDPLNLTLKPIPASQALLAMEPTSPKEVKAFLTTLEATKTDRYDFSPEHFASLAEYWKSQGNTELANALDSNENMDSTKINRYGADAVDVELGLVLYLDLDPSATLGALSTNLKPVRGKIGKGLYFNGETSLLEIASDNIQHLDASFTVCIWLKPESISPFQRWIARPLPDTNKGAWQVGFGPLGHNQWGISTFNDAFQDYWVNDDIKTDAWVHLSVVVDQALGEVRYYKNGEFYKKVQGVLPFSAVGTPLLLGSNAQRKNHFKGILDELYLYKRALSAIEIKTIYLKE